MKSNSKENPCRDAEAQSTETKLSVAEKFPRPRASARENWKRVKLGEVCPSITDGSHNPPKGVNKSSYMMLSSKNIFDGKITFDFPRYLTEEQFYNENRRTNINSGDVLMTIVGTVGRATVVPPNTPAICLQRSVAVLKPDRCVLNERFLMYALHNMRSFFEKESHGVAQKGIYLKQISEVEIPLPPLEEQRRIAGTLDKVRELIDLRERELAKFDELVKCRFCARIFQTWRIAA